jgi:hypothetical protein
LGKINIGKELKMREMDCGSKGKLNKSSISHFHKTRIVPLYIPG